VEEPGEAGSFDGNGRLFPSGSFIRRKKREGASQWINEYTESTVDRQRCLHATPRLY